MKWLTMAMYNCKDCMRECNGTGISLCDIGNEADYIDAFIINVLLKTDEMLFIASISEFLLQVKCS